MAMFRSRGFTLGLSLLATLSMGMFGMIFVLPIFLENVLELNAIQTGLTLVPMSASVFLVGLASGFLAARFGLKRIVVAGMFLLVPGTFVLVLSVSTGASALSFAPALALFGAGFGLGSSQLNNIILSSAPDEVAGEASAMSIAVRQLGFAVGVAVLGSVLAGAVRAHIPPNVRSDASIPQAARPQVVEAMRDIDVESGRIDTSGIDPQLVPYVKKDVDRALATAARLTFGVSLALVLIALVLSLLLPRRLERE
jgi:MFS family permease